MQLIILAAGKGSRLPKKFRSKPKCLTEINSKSILDHNLKFYKLFNKRYIISGYKSNQLRNYSKINKFKIIYNSKYKSTNMVYSAFLSSKYITNDVVICYGDILFDPSIIKLLKDKHNILTVYTNWLNLWKKRMSKKMIKLDAENLITKNKEIKSIGGPIIKKYPKYQYMGILKIKKHSFFDLKKFFDSLNDQKIDMTNFLNKAIVQKKISFKIKKYSKFWYEIDTHKDIKVATEEMN
tara:strand:+ start:156 stop:869 length:714 start_codon:yes stop_codon:yes gene_type:complete